MTHAAEAAERLVAAVGEQAEASALVFVGESALTRFANSFIHQNVAEDATSATLTVVVEGRRATQTTNRLDDEGLASLVEHAMAAARLSPTDEHWPGLAPPADPPPVEHFDADTAAAQPAERAAIVARFVAAGEGLDAAGFCSTEGGMAAFANSAGQIVHARTSSATLDAIHQTASSAGKAYQAGLEIGRLDGAAAGRQAAETARRSADAEDVPPGRYEVVLLPEAVATLAMFLALYGFNAKEHLEGQSFVALGEQQFDPSFGLWDDATDPRTLGLPFDLEGTPKRRVDMVHAGNSASLVHDRRTARILGTESTGHSIGSAAHGAVPINLFVQPGDRSTDELVGGVERGLLVSEFNYCRPLDPKTLAVTGLTRNGTFLIEGGEVSRPVSNLRFTQSFVEALAPGRIIGIGKDARLAAHELSDMIPGGVHVPALRLAEWNFTGGARG